jgi:hypothetical protein
MVTPTQIIEPEWILPFEGMQVGDSFFIPTLRPAELIYSIDCGAKRVKMRMKVFVTTKDDTLGVRAWRIA